jgi:guanylate kinase
MSIGELIVVTGPAAVGKSTLTTALQKRAKWQPPA